MEMLSWENWIRGRAVCFFRTQYLISGTLKPVLYSVFHILPLKETDEATTEILVTDNITVITCFRIRTTCNESEMSFSFFDPSTQMLYTYLKCFAPPPHAWYPIAVSQISRSFWHMLEQFQNNFSDKICLKGTCAVLTLWACHPLQHQLTLVHISGHGWVSLHNLLQQMTTYTRTNTGTVKSRRRNWVVACVLCLNAIVNYCKCDL
jgi:hypothetical protein